MNIGILFGISYAIIVSIGKTVLKKGLVDFKPSISFFWESIFGLLIWVPAAIIAGVDINQAINIFPVVLMGAILSEAYIFYIYSKGDLSIIGTVFPTYSIFTIFFAFFILGERLSPSEVMAISITILGVILIALPTDKLGLKKNFISVLWALSGAIAIGFADSFGKGAINETSAFTFLFTLGFTQIPVSLAFLKLEKESIKKAFFGVKDYQKYKLPLISAFLIGLAQLFFWLSFEGVDASIASPITSSNAMFTAILAIVVLKESSNKPKVLGISLVTVGLFALSIS